MDDLISRRAVLYAINKTYEDTVKGIDRHSTVHGLISAVTGIYKNTICLLPSAQPEQKKGKWLSTSDDNKKRCSECDVITLIAQYPFGEANFCPNCGAKMER